MTINYPINEQIDPSISQNFTFTEVTVAAYEIKYRKKGETTWLTTGKVTGNTPHTFVVGTFDSHVQYEWKVRTWASLSGTQSAWSSVATFTAYKPKIGTLKPSKLRIVALGDSLLISNLRIKTPTEIGEIDLVNTDHLSASKFRINANGVKALTEELDPHYADYVDHSDTGYIAYSNHTNSGYSAYSNHTDTGSTAYSNHTNTGYSAYSNHVNHTDYDDLEEPGYSDHSNLGYDKYADHIDTGYSVYSDHTDSGYDKYSNFSNSGYSAYSNHADS